MKQQAVAGVRQQRVRRPNPVTYFLTTGLIRLIVVVLGLKWDTRQIRHMRPPYLLICNHTSVLDFAYVAAALFPHRAHFVVANFFYKWKVLARFLRYFGCIPKLQFQTDVASVMAMKQAVGQGGIIILFPGGQVTGSGRDGYLHPGIARLVKWLDVPVVLGKIEGGYMKCPKWGKGVRWGRVHFEAVSFLTREALLDIAPNTLFDKIQDALSYNEPRWAGEKHAGYWRPNRCRGLENLLYRCPQCGSESGMCGSGAYIRCAACGFAARMKTDGTLVAPEFSLRIDQWYDLQVDLLTKQFADPAFTLEDAVILRMDQPGGGGLTERGRGYLTLNRSRMIYEGSFEGANRRIEFDMALIPSLPCALGKHFEVPNDKRFYSFQTADPRRIIKWVIASDILRVMREKTET